MTDELKKIRKNKSKTLGFTIKDITKQWFQPPNSLSKLSIALYYEDIVKDKAIKPLEGSIEIVARIKELMKLKGEKSADKGVFEEIYN